MFFAGSSQWGLPVIFALCCRKVFDTGGKSAYSIDLETGGACRRKITGEKRMNLHKTLRYAFRQSLPVLAGYTVLGMGFGVLLRQAGYEWWWAVLMSITMFSGSMQYVAVDLLATGASVVATAIMALMVNIRYLFYGVSMLERYRDAGPEKPYLIAALTDENYSIICSPELPEGVSERWFRLSLCAMTHCYWIFGSVLGDVLGGAFHFNSAGIEFSMTALFVVIFVEQWQKTKQHLPAVTGVVITAVCLAVLGPTGFLIPSMIAITLALFLERRWLEDMVHDA